MKILIDEIKLSAAADPAEKEKVRVYLLFLLEILHLCVLLTSRIKEVLTMEEIINQNVLAKLNLDVLREYLEEFIDIEEGIQNLLLIFCDSALLAFENGSREYLFVKEFEKRLRRDSKN